MNIRSLSTCAASGALFLASAITVAPASAAVVSGTLLTPPFPPSIAYPGFPDYTQVNLTTAGDLDWLHVGEASIGGGTASSTGYNEKSGASIITSYTQTDVVAADTSGRHFVSFTDGTAPVASTGGNQIRSHGTFTIDLASSASSLRQLDVYVTSLGAATGTFTASLLDSGNAVLGSYSANLLGGGGDAPGVFRITFQGNVGTDHLLVTWSQTAGGGSGDQIALSSATVSLVPEPATLALGLLGLAVLKRRRA